jgi:hypothetical protein
MNFRAALDLLVQTKLDANHCEEIVACAGCLDIDQVVVSSRVLLDPVGAHDQVQGSIPNELESFTLGSPQTQGVYKDLQVIPTFFGPGSHSGPRFGL